MSPLRDALAGIRVLDFTQNLPGPYATSVLASLGAEVIKIEPPRGEPARLTGRLFEIVNAGKRSVVLDLKQPEAAELARKLALAVDVVVEGFRPGVMARFGCDAESLRRQRPQLIHCSMSGFGQIGPYRDDPGHDLNFQALTGICHMMRDSDGTPHGAALPIADLSSALTASTAIVAALFARERTGQGRTLDVGIVDTVLSWAYVWSEGLTPADARLSTALGPAARALQNAAGQLPEPLASILAKAAEGIQRDAVVRSTDRLGERLKRTRLYDGLTRLRLHALPHYGVYRTRDDRYLSIAIVDEDKFWQALCEGLGLGPLGAIPLAGRFAAAGMLKKVLTRSFARHPLEHWLNVLDRQKIPVAPVLPLIEALGDPQLATRIVGDHVHAPFVLARPLGAAPRLGADTEAVLSELLARP